MSTTIPYRTPTVIQSVDEYKRKLKEYRENSNSPKYRIEYFHEFKTNDSSGKESNDANLSKQLNEAVLYFSSQTHIAQFIVNNYYGYFAQDMFEIRSRSGVLFYRDNVMVSYIENIDFESIRYNVYDLEYAKAKHSPKRQRLIREGVVTEDGKVKTASKGGDSFGHSEGYASQGCNCTIQ
ncbi:hypothetical protein LPJ53_006117 [Coemansia erecta]|uniref:Uncharacterized protein n=1 Tax=Coemansia erecta TaxID=147472 RepID=A0A9W7XV75_9FUNG|nr:hypothetical protein LPJ53_006117 [Coemansia erecta]